MEVDAERTGEPHRETVYLVGMAPPRIQIQDVQPQVDCGRYPVKACLGDAVHGRRHDLPGRPREDRGRRPLPAGRRPAVARAAARGAGATTASSRRSSRTRSARGSSASRPGSTRTRAGSTSTTARSPAGQSDLRGELSEGRQLFGDGRRRGLARGGRGAPLGPETSRGRVKSAGAPDRRRPRARALRRVVRAVPALVGRLSRRREGACPSSPRSASTSSTCRRCTRSARRTARAATTPRRRGRATPAAPGRSAAPPAVTTRSHPDLGSDDDFARDGRGSARGRARDRARLRDPVLARPPVAAASTPSGSTAGPTARSSTPRTRRSATRTSTTSTGTRTSATQLWQALLDVVLGWCARGVLAFRVDNPHTKPMPFWEWLIAEVRSRHPEAIFLAEAFTRPAPMTTLAKIGFSQSYTYFTWKNTKAELVEFVEQVRSWSAYYRPNMWPNTPDILHEYLQEGGRPGVRGATRARDDAVAELRDLLRLRGVREHPRAARAARSTSTPRSTRSSSGR